MTVSEMIEWLKMQDQEAKVFIFVQVLSSGEYHQEREEFSTEDHVFVGSGHIDLG